MEDLMEKIISLCKRRGFVFQSSEIYGGVEALWDYGPLGILLKNNIKKEFVKKFVQEKDNVVLIDGTVIMHPKVWETSGHLKNFTDPLVECKQCHARFREDQLMKKECPKCQSAEFTPAKNFNLMFKTFLGPVAEESGVAYLRPETAQSMFTNFKLVQESMRLKVPFGIAQIGHCFRNEITTGNFTFRSREFDIAEIEYFVKPGEDDIAFGQWLNDWENFFLVLGLKKEKLRRYEHPKKSLAHYSKRTVDLEYEFPWGFAELAGVANRTDFDLKQHAKASGRALDYTDPDSKEKYIPYVVEPTMGIERLMLALLVQAYEEEKERVVLKLSPRLAPYQAAVFPLLANKPELVKLARKIYDDLRKNFMVAWDDRGNIGKRYYSQDEIGTPYCLTVDFDSLEKNDVTIRDRDTMKQERVKIDNLVECLRTCLRQNLETPKE